MLGRGSATIPGGQSATVKLTLTKHGPSTVARGRGISLQVTTVDSAGNTVQTATVNFNKKKKARQAQEALVERPVARLTVSSRAPQVILGL